jgi:hypothetical protein
VKRTKSVESETAFEEVGRGSICAKDDGEEPLHAEKGQGLPPSYFQGSGNELTSEED